MRAENTFGIDFIIRLDKGSRGNASLFARVTIDGESTEISLKQKIKTASWDSNSETIKGRGPEVQRLNVHISNVRFLLQEKYRMLQDKGEVITADEIKFAYLGKQTIRRSGHTLLELMQYHTTINKGVLADGTMKNYYTSEEYVKLFIKSKFKRDDLFLTQLNYQFITDLENYIRNRPIKAHDPCNGNGVYKHLERIKKMMKWSKNLGWIKYDPFENYKLSPKKTKRKKLHIDELIRVEKQSFKDEKLRFVKDLFIFGCYTGLSYIDVVKLTADDIIVANNGKLWLNTYRQKNDGLSPVPVFNAAIKIMDRYKNTQEAIVNGTIFPPISNQELNRNLKIIREVCKITKEMTFHVARHTFATTVTLKNGVPLETVSKMLGHSKLSTTQIYADVDEEKIGDDMADVENRLNRKKEERALQAFG